MTTLCKKKKNRFMKADYTFRLNSRGQNNLSPQTPLAGVVELNHTESHSLKFMGLHWLAAFVFLPSSTLVFPYSV